MTRLQEVAGEFSRADEALRKALLRAERAEQTVRAMRRLMGPKLPKRIWVNGRLGLELHSLPLC